MKLPEPVIILKAQAEDQLAIDSKSVCIYPWTLSRTIYHLEQMTKLVNRINELDLDRQDLKKELEELKYRAQTELYQLNLWR